MVKLFKKDYILAIMLMVAYELIYNFSTEISLFIGWLISALAVYKVLKYSKISQDSIFWKLIAVHIISAGIGHSISRIYQESGILIITTDILFLISGISLLTGLIKLFKRDLKFLEKDQLKIDIIQISVLVICFIIGVFYNDFDYAKFFYLSDSISGMLELLIILCSSLIILFVTLHVASIRIEVLTKHFKFMTAFYYLHILIVMLSANLRITSSVFGRLPIDLTHYISIISIIISVSGFYDEAEIIRRELVSRTNPYNIGTSFSMYWFLSFALLMTFMGFINLAIFLNICLLVFVMTITDKINQNSFKTKINLINEKLDKADAYAMIKNQEDEISMLNMNLIMESTVDPISSLFNRTYFIQQVDEATIIDNPFTIVLINVSRFGVINELYGYETGDKILFEIALRLKEICPDNSVLSRFCGDEFALILHTKDDNDINEFIDVMIEKLLEKYIVDDLEFALDLKWGISIYPDDSKTANELLKYANVALNYAKINQGDPTPLRSVFVYEKLKRKSYMELELRNIDMSSQLEIYYQAQIDTISSELVGIESLLRWKHPVDGFISPVEFIPIAEEIGAIHNMTYWVLQNSMEKIKDWNIKYDKNLRISVNISARSFHKTVFLPTLEELLETSGISPSWFCVEITEHSAMSSSARAEEFFTAINSMGIRVSIDDFGTGYSSISYLRRFDVDEIKIDKELVDNIAKEHTDYAIINAVISMAKALEIDTVVEGVETKEQYEILRNLGCNTIQGFYFAKPMEAVFFEERFLGKKSQIDTDFEKYF